MVIAQVTHMYKESTTRINLIDKRRGLKKEREARLLTVNSCRDIGLYPLIFSLKYRVDTTCMAMIFLTLE
jgi:hypothetical protein